MRPASLLPALLLAALPACHSEAEVGEVAEVARLKATANRDLDVLFVIDNSPSMADKQKSLVADFPLLMDRLATLDGGLPNLHIGVVTSDLGSTDDTGQPGPSVGDPGQQGACLGSGDDGALQHASPAVADAFISDIANPDGTRARNYTGDLRDVFTTNASVGENGCGYEQHLRAMKRGLTNPANDGFLRAGANLAVVIVADEDDCSMRDANLLAADDPTLGPLESYRCTRFGVRCDPDDPTTPRGDLHDCAPRADSAFVDDVQPFVDFLTQLKPDPRMVMVAAIVGDPAPFATELRSPGANAPPIIALAHSCTFQEPDGTAAVADPAVRLAAFLDGFPDRSVLTSICSADLGDPLSTIGASARRLIGEPCLDAPALADTSADPGLQPACDVRDVRDSAPDDPIDLPACSGGGSADCYQLVADASACPSAPGHLRVQIHRAAQAMPDAWTQVRCRIAP